MSLLSDYDIQRAMKLGDLIFDKLADDAVQPASVDLRLGGQFRYWPHRADGSIASRLAIDPLRAGTSADAMHMLEVNLMRASTFRMAPGQFLLAHTEEALTLGPALAAQVYGKSSIGRCGLRVENAGYIDPGFSGQITLELRNETEWPIILTVGMPICQVVVHRLTSTATEPYGRAGSRYQGQMGATPSAYGAGREPIVPTMRERVAVRLEDTLTAMDGGHEPIGPGRWPSEGASGWPSEEPIGIIEADGLRPDSDGYVVDPSLGKVKYFNVETER